MALFSCNKSDASSCPTTPSSTGSHPNQEMRDIQDIQDMQEEFYALQDENQFLRSKMDSLAERLEYLQTRLEEQEEQQRQQQQQQQQSHKQWIAENLEEAQHFIDNIVGIKGITEDPHGAAVKLGISQSHTENDFCYKTSNQQLQRVSISSSIVPPHEELYGY